MTAQPQLTPTGLRCGFMVNPLAVAPDRVRLSWMLASADAGCTQSAYQIQVTGEDAMTLAGVLIWDSGQVESSNSTDVPYSGHRLVRGGCYVWRVRVWDQDGHASDWSEQASFEVELDPVEDWHGYWISPGRIDDHVKPPTSLAPVDPVGASLNPPPYLRRAFVLDSAVASARLYITALGLYEARLNGHRVSGAFLTPGWTDYTKRIAYQAYDVTSLLTEGDNVLGAIIADGWYAGFVGFDAKRAGAHYGRSPELLAELVITYRDGTTKRVVTDEHWQASTGAIRHADLLMGERQDLRLEPHGWDAPGFDARAWPRVACRGRDSVPLVADPAPPIRVTEEIAPVRISRDPQDRQIVDFGQNLTGWVRIIVDGVPGTLVSIRHGEVLGADGTLYTKNLRTARQTDEFLTSGGTEVLEPRFTVHGFRYAEVSGYPGDLSPNRIQAQVVHSDIALTGSFECSESWLSQLFRNIDWSQRGNFISVPTDCPQRDERLGWLGDAQIFASTACYNRDVAAFFGKWLDDVSDAQLPSGAFSDIAPRLSFPGAGAPAWGDAGVIVPWTVWKIYGDRSILERHFDAMAAWMDFIEGGNPDYLRAHDLGKSYNDWLAPGDDITPHELLATAYWAHDAALMAEIADTLGRADDASGFRALHAKITSAFAEAFVADDGQIASGSQTAYVLGLQMQLVPDELRANAAAHLVDAIRAAEYHLTTGFVGVGYLLPVLSSTGHTAMAYRLLAQQTWPSWRYMVDNGATTIWERWDGWTREHGFQSPSMNSFNHYSLGSVGEWLYRFILGIDQEPGTAGFGRLLLRPHAGRPLDWVRGSYRSVRGQISAGWQRSDQEFTYRVELPANVTGSVRIPSSRPSEVRDATGNPPAFLSGFPGAHGVQEAVFDVGPGVYEFTGSVVTDSDTPD